MRFLASFLSTFLCQLTTMGLIGHDKSFLHLTTGAPGGIHDACLLRHSTLFQEISRGSITPNNGINLRDASEIPLVTIGDSTFPRSQWLIKSFNENTWDQKERYFNKRLC